MPLYVVHFHRPGERVSYHYWQPFHGRDGDTVATVVEQEMARHRKNGGTLAEAHSYRIVEIITLGKVT